MSRVDETTLLLSLFGRRRALAVRFSAALYHAFHGYGMHLAKGTSSGVSSN